MVVSLTSATNFVRRGLQQSSNIPSIAPSPIPTIAAATWAPTAVVPEPPPPFEEDPASFGETAAPETVAPEWMSWSGSSYPTVEPEWYNNDWKDWNAWSALPTYAPVPEPHSSNTDDDWGRTNRYNNGDTPNLNFVFFGVFSIFVILSVVCERKKRQRQEAEEEQQRLQQLQPPPAATTTTTRAGALEQIREQEEREAAAKAAEAEIRRRKLGVLLGDQEMSKIISKEDLVYGYDSTRPMEQSNRKQLTTMEDIEQGCISDELLRMQQEKLSERGLSSSFVCNGRDLTTSIRSIQQAAAGSGAYLQDAPDHVQLSPLRYVRNCCAICLGPYEVNERIVWSTNPQCSHAFHFDCIIDWLLQSSTSNPCPCCRQEFIKEPS